MNEVDLGAMGFEAGGKLLVARALGQLMPGEALQVRGSDPSLAVHLRGWCRATGHVFTLDPLGAVRGEAAGARWAGSQRAGGENEVVDWPASTWGLAARGAAVEAGGPAFDYAICEKDIVWTDEAQRLYLQAAANQWDPQTAIDWQAPLDHPDEVEDAVVQVMTYLIENEMAALQIPAAFLGRIHPHFREVLQVLAVTAADEARHVEVFTRRARLSGRELGLSTVGGQSSLKTLLDEPDFALAGFMLSVLGEGSFLSLLRFLADHAPDAVTRQVCRLSSQDEARHVAFGLAHLERHSSRDPGLLARLASAVEQRHSALQATSGLNQEVFDALVLLAAGSWERDAIAAGFQRVQSLKEDMDHGRRVRLERIGFPASEAARLSALHTRNFM